MKPDPQRSVARTTVLLQPSVNQDYVTLCSHDDYGAVWHRVIVSAEDVELVKSQDFCDLEEAVIQAAKEIHCYGKLHSDRAYLKMMDAKEIAEYRDFLEDNGWSWWE